MKRITTSVVLTVALTITVLGLTFFFTGYAFAENHEQYESGAGITPLSSFYVLDRLAEKVQAAMITDTKKKLEFAFGLLNERTAEIKVIRKEKGRDTYISTKEYEVAADLRTEHIYEIGQHISKLQDEEIQRFYKKLRIDAAHSQEYLRQDLLSLSVKKKELREAIIEASKARDSAKTESLLEDLQKAKADYDRLAKLTELSSTATDIEVERIEDMFEDSMKREMVLERAKELESELEAYNPEENATVNSFAVKRIREIIQKLKTETFKKELENLDTGLAKLLLDSKKELEEFEKKAKPPEEKELDRKIAEERATKRMARPPADQAQKQAQPTQSAKQASPRPLGQPKSEDFGGPIIFNPLFNFQGTVGEKFEYSFCQPPIARASDICTAASTNPTGGTPPYHFELGSGGFPPFGITLNLNGLLSGIPSTEGSRTFSVCAIDLAGSNACRTVTLTVKAKSTGGKDVCTTAYNAAYNICNRAYDLGGGEYGDYNTFNSCISGAERKRDDCLCAAGADYLCQSTQTPAPSSPETSGTNCWVEREECSKKNENDRVACYNSCPGGSAGTQCSIDCTIISNEQADRCRAIPCQ